MDFEHVEHGADVILLITVAWATLTGELTTTHVALVGLIYSYRARRQLARKPV